MEKKQKKRNPGKTNWGNIVVDLAWIALIAFVVWASFRYGVCDCG